MKEDSLSTKDMLLNIGSMRRMALSLAEPGRKYSELLRIILEKDFYYDEDEHMPTLKQLSEKSGLNYGKIRKFIEMAYHDLVLNYEDKPVFTFSKVRYEIFIRGWRKNRYVDVDVAHIPVMPRVGEEFNIPFFSAYLGTSYFHVDEVDYFFEEDVQIVRLFLKPGAYNVYWRFRKDKAKEEGELPGIDWVKLDDFDLKRKLKIGRYKIEP